MSSSPTGDGASVVSESEDKQFEMALKHAWDWFSLHANQRLQTVNFFLIASAFLFAAYVTAIKDDLALVAGAVAALGVSIALYFYMLELRVQFLIKAAERAMAPMQRKLAEKLENEHLKIVDVVEDGTVGMWKYSKVFRLLYMSTGVVFVAGVAFSITNSLNKAVDKEATTQIVFAVLLMLFGSCWFYRLTSISQNHVSKFAQATVSIAANAAVLAGVLLILFVFVGN